MHTHAITEHYYSRESIRGKPKCNHLPQEREQRETERRWGKTGEDKKDKEEDAGLKKEKDRMKLTE